MSEKRVLNTEVRIACPDVDFKVEGVYPGFLGTPLGKIGPEGIRTVLIGQVTPVAIMEGLERLAFASVRAMIQMGVPETNVKKAMSMMLDGVFSKTTDGMSEVIEIVMPSPSDKIN